MTDSSVTHMVVQMIPDQDEGSAGKQASLHGMIFSLILGEGEYTPTHTRLTYYLVVSAFIGVGYDADLVIQIYRAKSHSRLFK